MFVCNELKPTADALYELIPAQGSVDFPRSKNKKLERFRVVSNIAYDVFNNGLGNRANQYTRVMNRDADTYVTGPQLRRLILEGCRWDSFKTWKRVDEIVAPIVRTAIIEAAEEQGIPVVEVVMTKFVMTNAVIETRKRSRIKRLGRLLLRLSYGWRSLE